MSSASSGFGGKLVLALVLAALGGYVWACVETGRSPLFILRYFSSPEPDPAPEPIKPAPAVAPKPEPPRPAPPRPEPVAPAVPLPAPAPEPVKPAVRLLSAPEVQSLFVSLDDHLRRGRLFEAKTLIENTSKTRIPPADLARFDGLASRVSTYSRLVQETTRGILIDMPKMSAVYLQNGNKLVVKILSDAAPAILFETITGIRGRIARDTIKSVEELKPAYASAEIKLELVKKAGYLGLEVVDHPGQPLEYRDRPNRPAATGAQIFFDLADFCARNGANDKLVPLFDEALRRDPSLLATVHEAKADRLVNVLFYFLSTNAGADAQKTLEQLKKEYADTRAYRERVAGDAELAQITEAVMRRDAGPIAKAEPPPAPKAPAAEPDAPAPAAPEKPTAATPEPARPQPAAPPRAADPSTTALPDGAPAKVRDFVARGDRHFASAMQHLQASDPNLNPDGWAVENKKALEDFQKANNEGYVPAQDEYGRGEVPQALLDRVRDTTMKMSLCRKRSVSMRK